jgi:hypothetical protein
MMDRIPRSLTADGYLVWPGDAVWVNHAWGWEQHTVGQCWPLKIAYTCVDRDGYVGSRIAKRVYFRRPLWARLRPWPPYATHAVKGHFVTTPMTWNCTPRIK